MARDNMNRVNIEGKLFNAKLEEKTVENQNSKMFGTKYITGTLDVAVDEDMLNVIPVTYSFVSPTFASGKENRTYKVLKDIMENMPTVSKVGVENAMLVRLQPSMSVNDFYTNDGALVSAPRLESGFINVIKTRNAQSREWNCFDVDCVIGGFKIVEPEDEGAKPYGELRGLIFNYKNEVMPVTFKVTSVGGMKFFEDVEPTNAKPYYTKLFGHFNYSQKVESRTEETAFGEQIVRPVTRSIREFIVDTCAKNEYEFGEEGVLTFEELEKMVSDRNLHLAELKSQSEERKKNSSKPAEAPAPVSGNPNFKF